MENNMRILGIDFGSSMTKMVLLDDKKIVYKLRMNKDEDIVEKILSPDMGHIDKIVMTGTGARAYGDSFMGYPVEKADEFKAVSLGGRFLSGFDKCIVASIGTGTSFVYVDDERCEHVGGSGMGGALLLALAKNICGISDAGKLLDISEEGDLHNVDLQIKDISDSDIDFLFDGATVANISKLSEDTSLADKAAGICNLVFQNIGVMGYLVGREFKTNQIVALGTVCQHKITHRYFDVVEALFNVEVMVPEDASYGVAAGAALLG